MVAGCGAFHHTKSLAPPPYAPETAIFVADGAGNFKACSKSLREAVHSEGGKSPPFVSTFEWSHGYGRILADQLDHAYARQAGQALAHQVEEFHEHAPKCRIYLMGHSAGTSVILSALEKMPPGVVERAFLVAPSVSTAYDLTPALTNVKHSIHVFYSRHDWYYLGLATHLIGTQDRHWIEPAAGRVGFRFADERLIAKLKQHPWKAADAHTGNLGGHFGAYLPEFLRRNVLPLTIPEANDTFLDAEDRDAELEESHETTQPGRESDRAADSPSKSPISIHGS